ncbi:MAG: DUF972 family protein [Clostridia bacterium]|jgi:regulator of replication initiation timing|nr:DUF972 family protein [Clostridia bacterium]
MEEKRLTQALIGLEEQLTDLLKELQMLKMHAYALEEENHDLKARLCSIGPEEKAAVADNVQKIQRQGFDNLVELYEQSYHICHLHFGQARDNDCLFCLGFLKRD